MKIVARIRVARVSSHAALLVDPLVIQRGIACELYTAVQESNVAFLYLCDTRVHKDDRRRFKDLIQTRRRETVNAPWLLGRDEVQNSVIRRYARRCGLGR